MFDANEKPKGKSAQDIADIFDIHVKTVRKWAKDGCPHTKTPSGARFDEGAVQAWVAKQKKPLKAGRPPSPINPDLASAKLRKENALAERYEIDASKAKRDLLPASEVQMVLAATLATFRSQIMGLPAQLTPLLEGRDAAERHDIIDQRLRDTLTQLAAGFERLQIGDASAEKAKAE